MDAVCRSQNLTTATGAAFAVGELARCFTEKGLRSVWVKRLLKSGLNTQATCMHKHTCTHMRVRLRRQNGKHFATVDYFIVGAITKEGQH